MVKSLWPHCNISMGYGEHNCWKWDHRQEPCDDIALNISTIYEAQEYKLNTNTRERPQTDRQRKIDEMKDNENSYAFIRGGSFQVQTKRPPLGLLCIPGDHWRCRYLLLGITFHFEFPEKGAVDVFKQHWASLHYVREIVRRTRPSYLKCFARGVGGWLSIKHWEYRIGFENMFSFTCDSPLLSTSILSAGGNKQHTTNFQWSMLPSFRMIGYWLGSAKAV